MQWALEEISMKQTDGVVAFSDNFLVLVFFLRGHFNAHKDILLTMQNLSR